MSDSEESLEDFIVEGVLMFGVTIAGVLLNIIRSYKKYILLYFGILRKKGFPFISDVYYSAESMVKINLIRTFNKKI